MSLLLLVFLVGSDYGNQSVIAGVPADDWNLNAASFSTTSIVHKQPMMAKPPNTRDGTTMASELLAQEKAEFNMLVEEEKQLLSARPPGGPGSLKKPDGEEHRVGPAVEQSKGATDQQSHAEALARTFSDIIAGSPPPPTILVRDGPQSDATSLHLLSNGPPQAIPPNNVYDQTIKYATDLQSKLEKASTPMSAIRTYDNLWLGNFLNRMGIQLKVFQLFARNFQSYSFNKNEIFWYDKYEDAMAYIEARWHPSFFATRSPSLHASQTRGNIRISGPVENLLLVRAKALFVIYRSHFNTDTVFGWGLSCADQISSNWGYGHGNEAYMDLTCAAEHLCRRCMEYVQEAIAGNFVGSRGWGGFNVGCSHERAALAVSIVQSWACEALQLRSQDRMQYWWQRLYQDSKIVTSSKLCTDLARGIAQETFVQDDAHVENSDSLGVHCYLTHLLLKPHKHAILQEMEAVVSWSNSTVEDVLTVATKDTASAALARWVLKRLALAANGEGVVEALMCEPRDWNHLDARFRWMNKVLKDGCRRYSGKFEELFENAIKGQQTYMLGGTLKQITRAGEAMRSWGMDASEVDGLFNLLLKCAGLGGVDVEHHEFFTCLNEAYHSVVRAVDHARDPKQGVAKNGHGHAGGSRSMQEHCVNEQDQFADFGELLRETDTLCLGNMEDIARLMDWVVRNLLLDYLIEKLHIIMREDITESMGLLEKADGVSVFENTEDVYAFFDWDMLITAQRLLAVKFLPSVDLDAIVADVRKGKQLMWEAAVVSRTAIFLVRNPIETTEECWDAALPSLQHHQGWLSRRTPAEIVTMGTYFSTNDASKGPTEKMALNRYLRDKTAGVESDHTMRIVDEKYQTHKIILTARMAKAEFERSIVDYADAIKRNATPANNPPGSSHRVIPVYPFE